jgi:hypothetical protein
VAAVVDVVVVVGRVDVVGAAGGAVVDVVVDPGSAVVVVVGSTCAAAGPAMVTDRADRVTPAVRAQRRADERRKPTR